MFNLYGKSDADIRCDVMNELKWNSSTTAEDISVEADDGVVTLRGNVSSYAKKGAAEKATQRVKGVRAIADELAVMLMGPNERRDEDIAKAALMSLEWNDEIPQGIEVTVDQGWVTLAGEADWDYERNAAMGAVSGITGVKGVTNDIKIKSNVPAADIKLSIEDAIKRAAETEGRKVAVSVTGDTVTLSGTVNSFAEMEDAKNSAWNARGVRDVVNNIEIAH